MSLLSRNLHLLSFTGLWRPITLNNWKAQLYNIYTLIVIFSNLIFVFSGLMAIDFKNTTLPVIVDNVFIILVVLLIWVKISCAVTSRRGILDVINRLENRPYVHQDQEEKMIHDRYDRYTKYIFLYYPLVFLMSTSWYGMSHIFMMNPPNLLLFQGWFPYNSSIPTLYWASTVYQFYVLVNAGFIYLAFDPILPCFVCYIYAQIYILEHRFKILITTLKQPNFKKMIQAHRHMIQRQLISHWIRHHLELLSLVQYINSIFSQVIFWQYIISSLMFCTAVKVLTSTSITSIDFVGIIFAFLAVGEQIFVPCYAINQMILGFADLGYSIYNTCWYELSNDLQKYIIIIMAKTTIPISFKSGYFISLSLESFTKILKFSYTLYNVLE